jgi:hypothetical protein
MKRIVIQSRYIDKLKHKHYNMYKLYNSPAGERYVSRRKCI